ncbi:MAG: class I SAM-dependent methyltransferase [Deltaproteobacteria bacterium]|nr:class I SAM-dependent methyltransferase [Deltaproteobacteria bacterium]MBW2444549.1 class I SAM-dependent methyltransferase [Deltaproteobacteria bacterium]
MREIELEHVVCALCGNPEGAPAESLEWKGATLRYAVCPGCGLKYLCDRPTRAWYADFYRDEFWQSSRVKKRKVAFEPGKRPSSIAWDEGAATAEGGPVARPISGRVARQRQRAHRIWRIVGEHARLGRDARVLEIGAGFGETLALLHERTGCHGFAVEPSATAASHITDTHGFPVVTATLEGLVDVAEMEGSIDLAILSHVLENTIDPIESLRIIRRMLRPGGRVYIDTCNLFYNNAINPYHPFIFSPETLRAILGCAGFETQYTEHALHPTRVRVLRGEAGVDAVERARYLAVVATPSDVEQTWAPVDPAHVMSAQRRGAKLLRRAKRLRRAFGWLGATMRGRDATP